MTKPSTKNLLDSDFIKITEAKHHDPFSVLGRHTQNGKTVIRAYLPYAETVQIDGETAPMQRLPDSDFLNTIHNKHLPSITNSIGPIKALNNIKALTLTALV